MRYEQVWAAVDNLAKANGLSPSGLAKKAGLDSTTFNKSKRVRPDGKKRWPSLESINKILLACNMNFEQFYNLGFEDVNTEVLSAIPYIKMSKLRSFDKMYQNSFDTAEWGKIRFPDSADNLYAVSVDTKKYAPVFLPSTMLVVSKNSEVRRGDKVLMALKNNKVMIMEFVKRTPKTVELNSILDIEEEMEVDIKDIKTINRIVWASL